MPQLKEGTDYYLTADGLFVFTEAYHLKRGFCCNSGCRHCPYGKHKENKTVNNAIKAPDEQEKR